MSEIKQISELVAQSIINNREPRGLFYAICKKGNFMSKNKPIRETFSRNIKKYREAKGKTLRELENEIGIAYSTLANYERGIREPSYDTLIKLADYFNVSLDDIFEREIVLEDEIFIGIDNSTGDAWVEEFKTKQECMSWLKGENHIDKNAVYKKAIATWGKDTQITITLEEMAELQKELCKHLQGEINTGHIAEEIADVEIMLGQMKLLFDIEEMVESYKRHKLARLGERIEIEVSQHKGGPDA